MHTPHVVLPLNPENREYLVFGLVWAVVIGHNPEKESVARARQARATHYVLPGGHSSVVGYVQFPPRKKVRGEPEKTWFSAAQMFADRFPNGVHTYVVPIDDDHHWLVGSQDGEVIPGTDTVFESHGDALEALAALNEQYPGAISVTGFKPNSPTTAARMIELKHRLAALPIWARVLMGVMVVAMLIDQGAPLWSAMSGSTREKQRAEVVVDASDAWKTQLDRWQKTVQVDGTQGFLTLLSQIDHQVPKKLGGWPLASLECVPYPAGWKCSAVYKRGEAGSSTNQTLMAALPTGWTVQWLDIDKGKVDGASVSWAFPATRRSLDRLKLEDQAFVMGPYASQVQAVYAAFKVAVAPKTLPKSDVQSPTYNNSEGQLVSIPYTDSLSASARIPSIKGLHFEGPLRSMTVLPLTQYSVIKTFSIKVADSIEPSLANSHLTAVVDGVFYVQ